MSDFYKRPNSELSPANAPVEETSHVSDNLGIQMLGQIKYGSCRPRAILFKFLADAVGLESRLVVVIYSISSNYSFIPTELGITLAALSFVFLSFLLHNILFYLQFISN